MIGMKLKMSNIAWRNLVRGTASVLLAAGLAAPALADEAGDQGAVDTAQSESPDTFVLPDPIPSDILSADASADATADAAEPTEAQGLDGAIQIAQGITGYERRRSQIDRPLRGETVRSRPRPQYDPLGQRVGGFVLFPELDVRQEYESNIFAEPDNEEDDFLTRIQPNLRLRSDWNNHLLQLETGADIGRYWDNSDEDYEDYFLGASGRVDIRRSTTLSLGTRYRRTHESRESPDDADSVAGARVADEPTKIDLYSADSALRHDFGRINATISGSFNRITYDDPEAIGGGTITEHDRDRNIYESGLRVGYEIQPAYEAFVLGTYNKRDYDGREIGTDIDRDSDGYGVAVGMDVDLGGIIFGEFFIGYRSQSYDDDALDDFSGVGGGAEFTWNVTGLTTLTGSVLGDLRETTATQDGDTASGRVVATGEVRVDHELRRNILLGGELRLTRDDYEGIDRTDWVYGAGADVTYLINRYLNGGIGYEFRQREGDDSEDDFTNHVITVRLGLQY